MINGQCDECTGCGACIQSCPQNCISWKEDELGFKYPDVDNEKCIRCGLCEAVCPIENELHRNEAKKTYAVVNTDEYVLEDSTSGGAFSAIADMVFEENGTVYGCTMTKQFQAKHIRIEKSSELGQLRGAKYLQSSIENVYTDVERDLKQGKTVLFSGTPCQVAGLYCFLKRKYERLITCDVICHGVGSQKYFDKFMDSLKARKGEVISISFRDKEKAGWTCGGGGTSKLSDGEVVSWPFFEYQNYYYHYFLTGEIYRRSCYKCPYANTNRVSDITIGDFWGIEKLKLKLKTDRGCSLVIVNTEIGMDALESVKNIVRIEADINDAIRKNNQLLRPSTYRDTREQRIKEYMNLSGQEIQEKYLREHRFIRIKGWLKRMTPYRLKIIFRRFR